MIKNKIFQQNKKNLDIFILFKSFPFVWTFFNSCAWVTQLSSVWKDGSQNHTVIAKKRSFILLKLFTFSQILRGVPKLLNATVYNQITVKTMILWYNYNSKYNSCDAKLNFQQSSFQSHDHSNFILICWLVLKKWLSVLKIHVLINIYVETVIQDSLINKVEKNSIYLK